MGLLLLIATTLAEACNVPVFRYALERWRPDGYRLTVFHRGALSPADEQIIRAFEKREEQALLNVEVRRVDIDRLTDDETSSADRKLLATQAEPKLPWLVLQYPAPLKVDHPLAAGPVNATTIKTLTESPVRTEVARRLSDGQSAVWLLLESGHAEQDKLAEATVAAEIKTLATSLKLPVLSDSPDDTLLADVPLRMEFSVLRVKRDDPAERTLVTTLLHSEKDLTEFDEPMVFPIFGRGRSLFALVGKGITPDNIRGSAEFLSGACSCEVKELNPGFDLLLTSDWNSLLSSTAAAMIAVKPRAKTSGEPELVAIPKGSQPEVIDCVEPKRESNWLISSAIGVMVVIAGVGLRLKPA
jgi:hypothetical protein